jgi:hypothetical protein
MPGGQDTTVQGTKNPWGINHQKILGNESVNTTFLVGILHLGP